MAHPNKSLRHWLVAAICCGLAVGSVGIPVNAGGVFFTPVAESLGVLRGTFSMHATLTLIGTAVISLFMPAFMRKYPLKLLLFVGVTMAVGSTIMMGAARSLPIFFILGTLRGVGAGLFSMVPVTMILNEWFEKHHGLVTSVVFSFTGVAGAVFSPLLAKLIESVGWQTAYIVMGLLMLAACAPALLFSFSLQPQKNGFLPYGDTIGTEEKNNTSRQPVQTGEIQSSVFFLLLGFGVLHTAITGIPQHFPGYAETIRYGTAVGGVMLSAAMLGNIGF
ncbi:MFS transporter [Atopococcus tabaci]|uniref:MFS transporter n=1 Tax=Atopococcus tabaci TaxID=269774 RepID=UPI000A03DF68|nr:MFS transporter [Atopococcus tabaci]